MRATAGESWPAASIPRSANAQARGERKSSTGGSDFLEEAFCPALLREIWSLTRACAERPERARVAVFGALWLQPDSAVAHEIPKPLRVGVPGMLNKRREPRRQDFRQLRFAGVVQRAGQQQRARIVVDAIAVRAVGHRVNGMLQKPRVVAHREKMRCAHIGKFILIRAGGGLRRSIGDARGVEGCQIAHGALLPGHLAAGGIGALAHGMPANVVGEQSDDLLADGFRIAERHEHTAAVGQQFFRMPIGRRNDRASQPKAVGQRAGRHLRLVEIRRDVDVAHRDVFQQCRLVDELVDEYDMRFDAELAHACNEALAIGFAVFQDEIGMCRAEDDIHGARGSAR